MEGKQAPDFKLADRRRQGRVALKDLIGKRNLVLYFLSKGHGPPGCTLEAVQLPRQRCRPSFRGARKSSVSAQNSKARSHVEVFGPSTSLNFSATERPRQ